MLRLSNNSANINEEEVSNFVPENNLASSGDEASPLQSDALIEQLQSEILNLTNLLQRTQADFINFKKRSEKEFSEVSLIADQKLATLLIPLLDEIDLAKTHNDYNGTTKSLGEKIAQLADRLGVSTFAVIGDEFDPNRHNAIEHTDSEEEVVTLVTIYQQGYLAGDRLVREAIVGTTGGK